MEEKYLVLTNNNTVTTTNRAGVRLEVLKGSALEVLVHARHYVRRGYGLLTHPLYGNFTPAQQPYRSLLLSSPAVKEEGKPHNGSLQLLESALSVYKPARAGLPLPGCHPAPIDRDYSFIDKEFLDEALERVL